MLDQVLIIGVWAHYLFRRQPLVQPLDYEPLGTFDTDIVVPFRLPPLARRFASGSSKCRSERSGRATHSRRLRTSRFRAVTAVPPRPSSSTP